MRRRTLLALTLVALTAAVAAWTFEVRSRPAPLDFLPTAPAVAVAPLPSADTGDQVWHLPEFVEEPAPRPVARPRRATVPAPDWSALRVDVAGATAPAPAPLSLAIATPPAELEIAMSARERRALIASAREAEMPGTPRGYRPGIAVIVPGGSSADGVCR